MWLIPRYLYLASHFNSFLAFKAHNFTDAIHLKQCVTLYLFALPMTLVHDLGWGTVPVVTAVAFTFMGIEGIADEIEMPFGLSTRHYNISIGCLPFLRTRRTRLASGCGDMQDNTSCAALTLT